MDDLTLLRSVRSDVPEASDDVLNNGRAALFNRINESGSSKARRRPKRRAGLRWAGAGIGVAGATAIVAGLVVTNVVGLAGWRGGAEPAAAEVLHSAALATIENSDPVLSAGQYLRVDTAAVYGNTTQLPDATTVSYLTITHDQLYVPADRSDDWVWVRGLREPYETFGPESAQVAEEQWAGVVAERGADYKEVLRAPKGAFYSYENLHSPDRLAALPRDPYLLLNHIYKTTIGQGNSADGQALVWITDTLRFGAVPAELRAALYNAAAMIPGVEITQQRANLNGTNGIAIGRLEEANGIRQDLIIDPGTGQLIGERQVLTHGDDQSGFPVGTAISWTAITTEVVNAAPEGGTPNGAMDEMGCEETAPGAFQCPDQGDSE